MDELGLCGFKNFGNTCWLNSTIQCLLKTHLMNNLFLQKNMSKQINNNMILTKEWLRLINGVNEENCTVFQGDKIPFAVAWVFLAGREAQSHIRRFGSDQAGSK